jgi:hypothetical protein
VAGSDFIGHGLPVILKDPYNLHIHHKVIILSPQKWRETLDPKHPQTLLPKMVLKLLVHQLSNLGINVGVRDKD